MLFKLPLSIPVVFNRHISLSMQILGYYYYYYYYYYTGWVACLSQTLNNIEGRQTGSKVAPYTLKGPIHSKLNRAV
jgi:hypothetical protein